MINLNVSKIKILNYTCCNTTVYLGTGSFNLPRGKSGLDLFLDSSEFFKGHQVVKSPKKALKRPKKCPKKGSQLKSGLKVPPPPPLWTSPDFCRGELNDHSP